MRDEEKRDELRDGESPEPFRRSGSGGEYDPNGNWAAERRRGSGSGATIPGPEGAPTGAGDGGFGPEGDYDGADESEDDSSRRAPDD
jgi:hypothetical protein